ncbi:hypothetical protein [uncultured Novosphingobium sp.]|uniref:hypothetical protein n=1 Tax=uncultured Novosphingobium sp. TaxID=292277 RepID=UPI002583DC1F|nr:hypothetical protein [uncultured Novosphingobium sp.]
MTNSRSLRISAFNNWPAETVFPVQDQYLKLLKERNSPVPMVCGSLLEVEDPEFHTYVAYILDGLDALPTRPDWAFESFYIPLELEMKRIKLANGNINSSRFLEYKAFLGGLDSVTTDTLASFIALAPLQTCEFVAKRILDAVNTANEEKQLYNRAKDALGLQLFTSFRAKYGTNGDGTNIRKAGSLIQLILKGKQIEIGGIVFNTNSIDRIGILSTFMMPSMRNDRFHGNVFPSFRSSAYKLKNYAGAQFSATSTFLLTLVAIAIRWPESLSEDNLRSVIDKNSNLFLSIFDKQLQK